MKRRGVITLVLAMELIFVAVLLVLFASMTNYASDTEKLQEVIVSEDIALLLDTMQATPYDLYYEYPESLFGKNLTIEGTSISVVDAFAPAAQRGSFFNSRLFSKVAGMNIPGKQVLQGTFLKITKTNNDFTLDDQTTAQQGGGSITVTTRTKEDLAIRVTYSDAGNQGQNQVLETLRDKTKAELQLKNYNVTETPRANLDIIFRFVNQTTNQGLQHRITHSLAQQGEVEHLAKLMAQEQEKIFSLPTTTLPLSYNNRPTISFDYLNTPTGFNDLNHQGRQAIIPQLITGFLDITYKTTTNPKP